MIQKFRAVRALSDGYYEVVGAENVGRENALSFAEWLVMSAEDLGLPEPLARLVFHRFRTLNQLRTSSWRRDDPNTVPFFELVVFLFCHLLLAVAPQPLVVERASDPPPATPAWWLMRYGVTVHPVCLQLRYVLLNLEPLLRLLATSTPGPYPLCP